MAIIDSSAVSSQYQNYFSRKLLDYAQQELRLNDYAQHAELPTNVGGKTISFFRYGEAASSNVQTLSEGTAISTFRDLTLTKIDATLVQYGEAAKITDIVGYTALFGALEQAIKSMGEDAALKADDLSRNELVVNATQERFAQGITSFANLVAASTSAGKLVATDILDSVTTLKIQRTPRFNGNFVAIVAPQVARDLMNDADWLQASKYSSVDQLFKGEVGMFHGARIVEATNPYRENTTENTYAASGGIFSSLILGKGAFGVPTLSGDSPFSPRVLVADKPDKADPLNQTMTAGWKAFYTAKILNPNWFVNLRTKTQYV
jgi:N4-gp56 family major capsid protein